MAQLFSFFSKDEPRNTRQANRPGPGNNIQYDPRLIDKFKGDHRKLLDIYNQIQSAIAKHNYALIDQKLSEFRTELQTHLLAENVRLYAYLAHQMAGDSSNSQLIDDFRHEMYGIGHTVMNFLRRYNKAVFNEQTLSTFKKELDEIGAVLVTRIKHEEETLYTLYMPPY